MKKGKYLTPRSAKRTNKKLVSLMLALALTIGGVVGGSLAWLTAETPAVTNTFAPSDINITLDESDDLVLKMVPGCEITKDPKVTVAANSEACWLFVKVEESSTLPTYIAYAIDSEWQALGSAYPGVYYRTVDADTAKNGVTYNVLGAGSYPTADPTVTWNDNQVAVKPEVTKAQMNALNATGAVQPTLTFTAYAIQQANVATSETTEAAKAAAAWAQISETP